MENNIENRLYNKYIMLKTDLKFHLTTNQTIVGLLTDYTGDAFIVHRTLIGDDVIVIKNNCVYVDINPAREFKK